MEYLRTGRRLERAAINVSGRRLTGLTVAWDDVVDTFYGPTRIVKGAFQDTIKNRGTLGVVKFFREHTSAIGVVEQAAEVAEGLRITARFSATPLAEESLELARDGALDSLSIGWEPKAYHFAEEDGEMRRIIDTLTWFESSIVPWGASGHAKVESVYQRPPMAMSVQESALAIIAYMERLTAQYTSDQRPATLPEPPRPLIPTYQEWPAALRPELIERRLQAVLTQGKAESYHQHARDAHRLAWAGIMQAKRERGY
jgi:HK97 family phage prohead protease